MEGININTTIKLNNGVESPILGLGTWQMCDKKLRNLFSMPYM